MESSVARQQYPCVIQKLKIATDPGTPGQPVQLSRSTKANLTAHVQYDCVGVQVFSRSWKVYSVPSLSAVPDWKNYLRVPEFKYWKDSSILHIPANVLASGLYLVNFSMTIYTQDPKQPPAKATVSLHIKIRSSELKALIPGSYKLTIPFSGSLTLDGSQSSDPDANDPFEGLWFSWFCTTSPSNYRKDHTRELSTNVCLPEQATLRWPWASGPVLTLAPETLQGGRVYFFRMMVQKDNRTAFSDKMVHVLPGANPQVAISCIENCGTVLVVSDRFSLFLNCTDCPAHNHYKWAILSNAGKDMQFDWLGQTTTGRFRSYLSVKSSALSHFPEDKFWVWVSLNTWGGAKVTLRHPFTVNHAPHAGQCRCHPDRGTTLLTQFVVRCHGFQDKDGPLKYKVIVSDLHELGEISSLKENTLGAILYVGDEPATPPAFLPPGLPKNQRAIKIYVQVYDSLGAFAQVAFYSTVHPPTDSNSSQAVLHQLFDIVAGPNSSLSALLRARKFLPAGYLMYIAACVLNSMKTDSALHSGKVELREHLANTSFVLPVRSLEEMSQVVMVAIKLTEKHSELTRAAQTLATVRVWQASRALQLYGEQDKRFRSEQIQVVGSGILTSLSHILKRLTPYEASDESFYVVESLADTILTSKVPENETTVLRSPSVNMYLKKSEEWEPPQACSHEEQTHSCLHPTVNVSLPVNAVVSTMFCSFAEDPFPWLDGQQSSLAEVVGFRMTVATARGDKAEITPEVVEVFLVRKNLSAMAFNLTVGPEKGPQQMDESLRKTTGAFRFQVDSRAGEEVLVHIVTEVTVLFSVSVYAGDTISPAALVATYLVPWDIPPVANQSGLYDPACKVNEARVLCLPPALLQLAAQRSNSSQCNVTMVLQAPRFVMKPTRQWVRISIFRVHCLKMYGVQRDWQEHTCVLGGKTTWHHVHCICWNKTRARRQLNAIKLAKIFLTTYFLTAKVFIVPNPVDLRFEVIKTIPQNPVTLFTVLFIVLLYVVLAFWALHRDEADQYLREHVIVLPDNDPDDSSCYLVTVFTGSRLGSGTRADVFLQLSGTQGSSTVHCLSHLQASALPRGSISTFLLTTGSDLGDVQSVRVWHNNEGRAPHWYLSRIKVESLFRRHIWLFMCRQWFSTDTCLHRVFHAHDPDQPVSRKDFFLINMSYSLGKNHIWFSIFSHIVPRSFNRLQRLSCCLAMLLSSLLCNIMFLGLTEEENVSKEERYLKAMLIGMESVVLTLPVQIAITVLFTYSQRKPQAALEDVSPQEHFQMSKVSGTWKERLEKWHSLQTAKAARPPPKAPAAQEPGRQQKGTKDKASKLRQANKNASNKKAAAAAPPEKPSSYVGNVHLRKKPRLVLPWWCASIAWFLVFATSGLSSFFIMFYGLTYGYEKSLEWLFASFCAFCQSVFLVQPSKIIFVSGLKTYQPKYCKNLSWVSSYHYSEIKLQSLRMRPQETEQLKQRIRQLQRSRMYRPLTEDEISIFLRKKQVRRHALLFLSYILTHFLFLALLLGLATVVHQTDSFYCNQFFRGRFSAELAGVTQLKHIYQWLDRVALPLLHNDLNPTFLPDSSWKILGLPRMRQVRAKPGEKICLPAKNFVQNQFEREIHCHPDFGADPEDTASYSSSWSQVQNRTLDKTSTGFTYRPQEKKWAYYSHGLLHTYGSGGYAFHFFPGQQRFNSTLRLKELQSGQWLDEKTWAVILELTTFNPDVSLFSTVSVIFEVSQLGVVNSSLWVYSFALADFNSGTSAEIYLYVAILIFFSAYVVDEVYVILQERAAYVRSVCNLFNFALKCIFAVLIAVFVAKHLLASSMIRSHSSHLADFTPFHVVSQVDHAMRVILGFLLFLTILKSLRYSRFFYDVRLAQRAIQTALPGICHMALVVSVYFFVYMAFGYLVFGQHEWNYSSLAHAMQTVFSYCVSAFQNTEFSSNRILGVLFLSSFMLVMICILINLFQAVILSSYEDMKQPVYEEPSEEAEAMTYLCHKLRLLFSVLSFQSKSKEESELCVDMLYGQPEKNSRRYLGLKTRNINGKKMAYLVV